jgi:hypothetical protein
VVFPAADQSRAVLIGVSGYTRMEPLTAVRNNLPALSEMLTSRISWGLAPEHCRIVSDPRTSEDIVEAVADAAREATDALLIYFSGHGFKDPDSGALCLAHAGSRPAAGYTAVYYDWLRNELRHSRARRRIVLLDCCFAASAFPAMTDPGTSLADQAAVEGTYLIAAAGASREALAEDGGGYTAFTGALLRVLREGLEDGPENLDLDTVFSRLELELRAASRPQPHRRVFDSPGRLSLARNAARSTQDAPVVEAVTPPAVALPEPTDAPAPVEEIAVRPAAGRPSEPSGTWRDLKLIVGALWPFLLSACVVLVGATSSLPRPGGTGEEDGAGSGRQPTLSSPSSQRDADEKQQQTTDENVAGLPDCTPEEVTLHLSSEKSTYARGELVKLHINASNNAASPCRLDLDSRTLTLSLLSEDAVWDCPVQDASMPVRVPAGAGTGMIEPWLQNVFTAECNVPRTAAGTYLAEADFDGFPTALTSFVLGD